MEYEDEGIDTEIFTPGENSRSAWFGGVLTSEGIDADVIRSRLLDFGAKLRGAGEGLRSPAGDFEGTAGG